ncbi:MAG: hypothetical protein ACOC00_00515 [Halothiobacillaceae bacterium]
MNPERGLVVIFIMAVTLLVIPGCGPVYQTEYRYSPPADSESKRCITECARIREMCRATAEARAAKEQAACQQNASIRYAACLATASDDAARQKCSLNTYCDRDADTAPCDADYRQCYQTCGGTVEAYQVCVFGC